MFSFKSLFGTPDTVNDVAPTPEQLSKAKALSVLNAKGESILLGDVLKDRPTILILVRHHHCGICIAYCAALAGHPALAATVGKSSGTQVVILGHGTWKGIDRYKEIAGMQFDMYTDESRKVYEALGVTRCHLDAGDAKNRPKHYGDKSALSYVLSSLKETLGSGWNMLSGGDSAQLGADFIISADGQVTFTHRMQNTADHTEVDDIVRLAGLEVPAQAQAGEATAA